MEAEAEAEAARRRRNYAKLFDDTPCELVNCLEFSLLYFFRFGFLQIHGQTRLVSVCYEIALKFLWSEVLAIQGLTRQNESIFK